MLEATTLHDIEEIGEQCVLILSVRNIKPVVVLELLVVVAHLEYIYYFGCISARIYNKSILFSYNATYLTHILFQNK